jgi:hypothetical protein
LLTADHRPNHRVRIVWRADFECFDLLLQPGQNVVEPMGGSQDAGAGDAGLAAVDEPHPQYGGNSRVQIGIVEDDVRSLAAKLQRHALEGVGTTSQDFSADRCGPGEGDLRDVRMPAEFRADDIAEPVDDIEHALWQTRFMI